jgi:hypothetical protein
VITPEQEQRGLRGEEELKARLQQPDGWEGFKLIKDRRKDGCGYDFLCQIGERKAELEVKTFAPGGQVVVTPAELQEASTSRQIYYLVGICDDGGLPHLWRTFLVHDPLLRLLEYGKFQIDTRLQASADTLFATDGAQ